MRIVFLSLQILIWAIVAAAVSVICAQERTWTAPGIAWVAFSLTQIGWAAVLMR